jgi:hypothetical protein
MGATLFDSGFSAGPWPRRMNPTTSNPMQTPKSVIFFDVKIEPFILSPSLKKEVLTPAKPE